MASASYICHIMFKKGDRLKCSNNRVIAVLNIANNVLGNSVCLKSFLKSGIIASASYVKSEIDWECKHYYISID